MYINKLLKKQLSLSAASLFLIVFVILGSSYALFESTQEDTNNQSMNVGDLVVAFNNSSDQTLGDPDALNINEMNPMSDEEGLALTNNIYTFTIKNTGTIAYTYTIALADNPAYLSGGASYDANKVVISKTGDTTIAENERPTWKNIHMNLKGYKGTSGDTTSTIITKAPFENKTFNLGTGTTNGIIYSSVVNPGESQSYKLQTWLNYDTTLPNKAIGAEIHLNITIEGEASDSGYQITNLISNGSFENSTTGWTLGAGLSLSTTQKKYGSNSIRNYQAAKYVNASKALIASQANHKYYFSLWMYTAAKGSSSHCYSEVNVVYDSTNHYKGVYQYNLNKLEKLGRYINDITGSGNMNFMACKYEGADKAEDCYCDGIVFVDLTETFGSGNEPDKAWCDANIDWFEGSKIIYKY